MHQITANEWSEVAWQDEVNFRLWYKKFILREAKSGKNKLQSYCPQWGRCLRQLCAPILGALNITHPLMGGKVFQICFSLPDGQEASSNVVLHTPMAPHNF